MVCVNIMFGGVMLGEKIIEFVIIFLFIVVGIGVIVFEGINLLCCGILWKFKGMI